MTDHKMTDEEFRKRCAEAEGRLLMTPPSPFYPHGRSIEYDYPTTDDLMRVCRAEGWRVKTDNFPGQPFSKKGYCYAAIYDSRLEGDLRIYNILLAETDSTDLPYDALKSAMMEAWEEGRNDLVDKNQ